MFPISTVCVDMYGSDCQVILESTFSHEPHEYLRDTLDPKYRECNSRANRTEFACVKCGLCCSCHCKMDRQDKSRKSDPSSYPGFVRRKKSRNNGWKKLTNIYWLQRPLMYSVNSQNQYVTTSYATTSFLYIVSAPANVGVNILKMLLSEHKHAHGHSKLHYKRLILCCFVLYVLNSPIRERFW